MTEIKPGTVVRFLNTTGGGRVSRVDGRIAYVEDTDGFEVPTLLSECVAVGETPLTPETSPKSGVAKGTASKEAPVAASKVAAAPVVAAGTAKRPKAPVTDYGDKLTLQLAFEPVDRLRLSSTSFEMMLVNDSNYSLQVAVGTRPAEDSAYTLLRADVVEPNEMLLLGEFSPADVNSLEHILLQAVAFKADDTYEAKPPVTAELHIDTTKFFKLHCYRPSRYFDSHVLSFDIIADDVPALRHNAAPDAAELERELNSKKRADRRPLKPRQTQGKNADEPLEVDLHINELVDTTAGLSRADMLNLQIDRFRAVMDENLRRHGRRIVFIHGKGEGILRQALIKELNHRYKGHDVCDASFARYGFGATQVTIR